MKKLLLVIVFLSGVCAGASNTFSKENENYYVIHASKHSYENSTENHHYFPFVCYEKKYENTMGSFLYEGCMRSNEKCSNAGKLHFGKYSNDLKAHEAFNRCSKDMKTILPNTLYESGLKAKENGEFQKAAEIFEKVSQNRYYTNFMMKAYLERGEFYDEIKAKHLFAKAIEISQSKEQEITARIALNNNFRIVSIEETPFSKKRDLTEIPQHPLCQHDDISRSYFGGMFLSGSKVSKKRNLILDYWDNEYSRDSAGFRICVKDTNKTLLQAVKRDEFIKAISFSNDETKIALATYDYVELWDIVTAKRVARLPSVIHIGNLSFSEDDMKIIGKDYRSKQTITYLFSGIQTEKKLDSLDRKVINDKEDTYRLSYDNPSFFDKVVLHDYKNKRKIDLSKLSSEISAPIDIHKIHFSEDKNIVIIAYGNDGSADYKHKSGVILYDIKQKDIVFLWKSEHEVKNADFFNNEKSIYLVEFCAIDYFYKDKNNLYGNKLSIVDIDSRQLIYEHRCSDTEMYESMEISQDGKTFLFSEDNGMKIEIELYDAAIAKQQMVLKTELDMGSYLTPSGELRIMSVEEWRKKKKKL